MTPRIWLTIPILGVYAMSLVQDVLDWENSLDIP